MKGIVFTELLTMVENQFGAELLDDVLDDCTLATDGAYTAVGTYDYKELIEIVSKLSQHTDIPFRDLVHKYGEYLFFRFYDLMPLFFEEPKSAFDFLESVHDYVHVEVKKLYPDADLPEFETERNGDKTLIMIYRSQCPFADFAAGLIKGCVDFYKENIVIDSENKNTEECFSRVFTLTKA